MRKCDRKPVLLVFILSTFLSVDADIYLHVPRGSNNRLNENTATRTNANRLFDSQNNNRGGYNAGDKESTASGNNETNQYRMKYFQSSQWETLSNDKGKSFLTMEWTNQHGCGGNEDTSPQKQNCDLILQYMCQDDTASSTDTLRNGVTTNTQDYTKPNPSNVAADRKSRDVKSDRGIHESWDWYNKCYLRERNKGLFVADQKLTANNGMGSSSAIYTRQNPTGNRYGYECPEERDYYPYWHPTPWSDIAIMTDNSSMCRQYISKSFNTQAYGECNKITYNNEADCKKNNGSWSLLYNYLEKAKEKSSQSTCDNTKVPGLTYKWARPYDGSIAECLVLLDSPDCIQAPWSRSNHLGNGVGGQPLSYTWTLPYFPSGKSKNCAFRIRYNISTDDYDPYNTDFRQNEAPPVKSPIQQNPYVYVMKNQSPLRLALNTAQYGRVFQDRSHVFKLVPRPSGLNNDRIYNLNVRGKRGNIVQTFPAVEYDFTPNNLQIEKDDLIHIQWTGSNTHNNNNPAGDGQAGDAGEGKGGTDRSNFVEMSDRSSNFPTPFEQTKMWSSIKVEWIYFGKTDISAQNLAINMASAGYYRCASTVNCTEPANAAFLVSGRPKMSNVLDDAPASYEGALLRFKQSGIYHYMCTRNNSFSNRSQKGSIAVK
uniref:Protein DD3-3 n=2 Tax=Arion vulgaris TaxID=1028688 RepID=A0A0B7ADP4_9EUPU